MQSAVVAYAIGAIVRGEFGTIAVQGLSKDAFARD